MQGKLISVVCIICVHIETNSIWAEYVNKIRCMRVCLVSKRGLKALNFDNFDNSHKSFL